MEEIRLQKYFTDCGVLSRRAAEAAITAGAVRVNGEVATVGQKIDPARDTVTYNGKPVKPQRGSGHTYILLHKPRGVVTTMSDEKGRTTVAALVSRLGVRVYPVGRLDMDSDGLLLMTNDGELANRLTHPRHDIPKLYRVVIRGEVTPQQLEALNRPFLLDGYKTRPALVQMLGTDRHVTLLSFELHEGRNRQIRRMCEQLSLPIQQLTRVAIGRLMLGELPLGHYRHLTSSEIAYLKGNTKQS